MTNNKNDKECWNERLTLACNYEADSAEKENEYFRNEASAASLEELSLFISQPAGRFNGAAKTVMEQVYRKRLQEEREAGVRKQSRVEFLRGLVQQVSSQVLGTLIVGVTLGFLTGVWFCE